MQEWPLLMHKVIDFAAIQFPDQEVVSRTVEGPMHATDYHAVRERALKVAKRLDRDGIKIGDRVATLAWNGYRHLESWYGIAGAGAVYHTVKPRLFPEQIAWIMNDAEDRMALIDLTFVPLLEAIADKLETVEGAMSFSPTRHIRRRPSSRTRSPTRTGLPRLDSDFALEGIRRAHRRRALLHPPAPTGHPKGVLYSHRSDVLHSMMATTVRRP